MDHGNYSKSFKIKDREPVEINPIDAKSRNLKNGDIVACKLQYPNMQSAVNADLNQFKIVLNLFEKYNKAIKTKKIFLEKKTCINYANNNKMFINIK